MTDRQCGETRAYSVSITFHSAGEVYASETMLVSAADEFDAERIARDRAADSVYHDARIPDLGLVVTVDRIEPPDPDDDPSAAAMGAVHPVCPKCGSDDVLIDAAARWDTSAQCWSLSGTQDCQTCQACGAEGDDLAYWELVESPGLGLGAGSSGRPRCVAGTEVNTVGDCEVPLPMSGADPCDE